MLRRNSSRNKHRRPLSRSKSTSSVVRNPVHALESIDPAAAERDAGIAALLSYHRAQERPSSEMRAAPRDPVSFFPDSSDGAPSTARQSLERSGSVTSRQGTATSVQFARPPAVQPRRNLPLRASEGRDSPTKATSRINVFGNTSTRPSLTMSFHADQPAHYSLTRRYLQSLQPPDACYSPEEDAASMSFSFRRLRKSRSMLTSSRATTENAPSCSMPARDHLPPTHSLYKATNNENEPPKTATPDATGLRTSRPDSRVENDAVVRLARDLYREQMKEQERLQPSASIRSRNKRSEGSTGLRKSLRNSSNNSTVLSSAFSANGTSVSTQSGLRKAVRKVSKSLRSKFKGLFARGESASGSEKDEGGQGTDGNDSDGDTCLHASNDEGTGEASLFRISSHLPSLHDMTLNQQLRSRKGSVESIESGEQHVSEDRSRVTSWTNSVTSTVSSMGMLGEWERQRLSVIKENGAHISSSSLYSTGHNGHGAGSQETWSGPEIDSERVYSALMKRHGGTSTGSDQDTQLGDAESVYSCVTEDARPSITRQGTSDPVGGAATRIVGGIPSCRLVPHQRDASTASSVEWKTWLSSDVSKLEGPSTPTKADTYGQNTGILPTLGHVREGAEVGSPPEILLPKDDGLANRSPLSCIKGNSQPVQDRRSQSRSPWKDLTGHDENRHPSIPPRSTLRTVPSLPVVSSTSEMNTSISNEVHRMCSLNITGRLNSAPEEAIAKRRSRPRLTGWQGSPTKSSPGIGHETANKLQQGMGSKMMVDMFLSNRQKEANGGDGGLDSSPAAFL
ncbi:uncharacterized protein NECHADRAFT_80865 [Fusarium vanettenii 77-13-4]|uniref:Uncharacterized protein n=1 Tax=Fusarium vanettenii (strain ATCC MYA-4622 / CBS 123669 / FGSC 9596 / NRRL 45880 / 77-13-4) TaxID=660122 RepID=C7YSV6_FUSV7|nr:uncharacterized protein NECHADRAFT_80865 [Fusarium vanettenii 77-13-4]EEU45715.1 hypothetical protein NECHADRAFT_80865 [Fusarium vanettenii 77-13-4]